MLEFLKFKFILQGEEMKTSIHSIKREGGGGDTQLTRSLSH